MDVHFEKAVIAAVEHKIGNGNVLTKIKFAAHFTADVGRGPR